MRRHIRRPSAALVVACGALFVALSGTSVATVAQTALPADSVGEVQIRDSAVTSAKVADETLQIVDLSPRARAALTGSAGPTGAAGPAGSQGPMGAKGEPGPPGVTGLETVQAKTPDNTFVQKQVRANCRGGRRVLGGGARVSGDSLQGELPSVDLNTSAPDRRVQGGRSRDGWLARARETSNGAPSWSLEVYAICGFVG